MTTVEMTVNGKPVSAKVEGRTLLVQYLQVLSEYLTGLTPTTSPTLRVFTSDPNWVT